MYTLGSGFMPASNHAGGLRYHGMSSVVSQLYHDGLLEAVNVGQTSVFQAAEQFARVEGILPAPEKDIPFRYRRSHKHISLLSGSGRKTVLPQ